MKIFPAVHYSMGGLWVDYEATPDGVLDLASPKNHMTNVPGLYAVGECDYQYHGANRLGANALLSCIYAGKIGGPAATSYATRARTRRPPSSASLFDDGGEAVDRPLRDDLRRMRRAREPLPCCTEELGDLMTSNVTIVRNNDAARPGPDAKILELHGALRSESGSTTPRAWSNQPLAFLHQLANMLELARIVVARGARLRDESRGRALQARVPEARRRAAGSRPRSRRTPRRRTESPLRAGGHLAAPAGRAQVRLTVGKGRAMRRRRSSCGSGGRTGRTRPASWEEFRLPYRPRLNVISCLHGDPRSPVNATGRSRRRRSSGTRPASRRSAAPARC